MAMRYELSGPAADGNYTTEGMGADLYQCELASIRFLDAAGAQVTPTAGSVIFAGSPDGENWRAVENGSFDAADAYLSTRVAPFAEGLMVNARVILSGVVGAETFVATVWRR